MPLTPSAALGKRGESIAQHYLISKGYTILAKNYRHRKGEIDLVAQNGRQLIAVEVKSRTSLHYGVPEAAISEQQIELISATAGHFQETRKLQLEIRFDVITVYFAEGHLPRLLHIRDAFHG